MRIPLAPLGITKEDIESAISVLHSGQVTLGSKVAEFEESMAKYLGVSRFVMVNSGSSANLVILESLLRPSNSKSNLSRGDKVIVPAIAWPTTVWPVIQLGLTPVFVDVNYETLGLDLDKTREVLSKDERIKAIFLIQPLGLTLNMREFLKLSTDFGVLLIEDTCESLGSEFESKKAGTFGIANSFSFYFSHHLTTMEGGGVATNREDIAEDLLSIRSHGWSRNRKDHNKWSSKFEEIDPRFMFVSAGYNVRPMEVQAAIGLSQLNRITENIERRRRIAEEVSRALVGTSLRVVGDAHLTSNKGDTKQHSWMLLPIRCEIDAGFSASTICKKLESVGIETRPPLTGNFTKQPALSNIMKTETLDLEFANADKAVEDTFLITCHHDLSDSELNYVIEKLNLISKECITG